jgi:hypothetical protein
MCRDVSNAPGEIILKNINADDGFSRSSNIGSSDVWHLPAAKEDAAYKDHATVVQKVGLRIFGEMKASFGSGLLCENCRFKGRGVSRFANFNRLRLYCIELSEHKNQYTLPFCLGTLLYLKS